MLFLSGVPRGLAGKRAWQNVLLGRMLRVVDLLEPKEHSQAQV